MSPSKKPRTSRNFQSESTFPTTIHAPATALPIRQRPAPRGGRRETRARVLFARKLARRLRFYLQRGGARFTRYFRPAAAAARKPVARRRLLSARPRPRLLIVARRARASNCFRARAPPAPKDDPNERLSRINRLVAGLFYADEVRRGIYGPVRRGLIYGAFFAPPPFLPAPPPLMPSFFAVTFSVAVRWGLGPHKLAR